MMLSQDLDYEFRTPIATFSIPIGFGSGGNGGNGGSSGGDEGGGASTTLHIGLVVPSIQFWMQIAQAALIEVLVGCLAALFIHKFVIQRRGSSSALLIGYGAIIPFTLYIPHVIIQWLNISNTVSMIVMGGAFILQTLRCIAAIHGTTTPLSVEKKVFNYCIYYCSIVNLIYDTTTGEFVFTDTKYRYKEALSKFKTFLVSSILLGLMFSILEPMEYKPYKDDGSDIGLFHWKHLVNNFCFAYTWHLCLLSGSSLFGFAVALLTGIQTIDLTINPLFGSSSPSDFWGRRWNNVVHKALKDAVFRPMIPNVNPALTVIAVFLCSGFLHEYILMTAELGLSQFGSDDVNDKQNITNVKYGFQTIFFLWNAIILLCEYSLSSRGRHYWMTTTTKFKFVSRIWNSLPSVVVSLLVVFTVLPLAHWFSDGMLEVSILPHYRFGFPMFVIVE